MKRGSRVSNLIASLWRAQTFAYLAYHISSFLVGFYACDELELGSSPCQALVFRKRFYFGKVVVFWMLAFGACRDLHDKTKFFENGFSMENLLRFRCGNIASSTLRKAPNLHMYGDFALFMGCNIF